VVIAIDGPSGVGKTTITKRVAAILGLDYLDTGSTYRAATVVVLRSGVDVSDGPGMLAAIAASDIDYVDGMIRLDGEDIAAATRSEAVTQSVTPVSANPEVRAHIVALQQAWVAARGGRAVVEGRDIGTVVFPDAPVKVFLTAAPQVRAQRRAGDEEAGEMSVDEIAADLERRDHADSTRDTSPLRRASDAVEIDTSTMGIEEVVARVLELVAAAQTPNKSNAPAAE
jgi:cytidylate kinase